MLDIKQWSVVLCICAVICAIIEIMAPGGNMDKILKTVLSGFVLCALIVPLKNIDLSFDFSVPYTQDFPEQEETQQLLQEQTLTLAEHKIKLLAQAELDKIDVTPENIKIFTDNSDISSISIITIEVTVKENYSNKTDMIKSGLEQALGLNVTVNIERN